MLEIMIEAARKAGKFIMDNLGKVKQVEIKKNINDLVTEIDMGSERIIRETLEKTGAKVLGEESWKEGRWDEAFIVDPLDGTLNFVHGLPFFSISIAFFEKGKVRHGVVFSPATDEMFYAEVGKGAFLNGEKIKVSDKKDLSETLFVTGWPYDTHLTEKTFKTIEIMMKKVQEVRILGSAALELCYIACGKMDGYWEFGLEVWDVAAGSLIAKEAGAIVAGITKEDFLLGKEILACTPGVFEETLRTLRQVVGEY